MAIPIRRSEWALLLQGALIVLPVTVLAYCALHLLRDDRSEVERQAQDSARLVAPELARQLGRLTAEEMLRHPELPAQGRITKGQAALASDYPRTPAPDDWPWKLSPTQSRLWQTAQDATYRRPDAGAARQALEALARSSPQSPPVAGNIELGLLELENWTANREAPVRRAVNLASRYPRVVTPSGTPVAVLALLLAVRHLDPRKLPENVRQAIEANTLSYPSFLTPELLQAAQMDLLQQRWEQAEREREQNREAMRSLLSHPLSANGPGEIWVGSGNAAILALTNPAGNGWDVTLVPAPRLIAELQKTVARVGMLPSFAGAAVEIGGAWRRLSGGGSGPNEPPVLTSAGGTLPLGGDHAFTLRLDLSNSAPLYARYGQRRRLVEWVVLSAVAAALIGLATLWTSYRRQARLNEMKSSFVSSVSHELRAPIGAVRLMAESLESGRTADPARQHDYYRLIVQECRRLSGLVENVLDFARIDQGRQRYRFQPVDAMELLRHTVMLMQPNAEQRQVRLVLTGPSGGWDRQPSWDGEAVEQSLVNLLDNAIKHSPEGAEVRIEMEPRADRVRLWVRDCGPGIPEADHARIFERFYRRGQELRRETRGVGIGLSIVKHVAEGHGGRVLLESMVGRGSSFGLELPLDAGAVP